MQRTSYGVLFPAFIAASVLAGCATFSPVPIEEEPFRERAQTQVRNGITVTAAVLDANESRRAFGVDLANNKIQPIYLKIHNDTDRPFAFLLAAVDPNYFSPREAAYKSHFLMRPWTNAKIDAHFDDHGIPPNVPPRESISGFVFSNLRHGTKEVTVRLFGPKRVEEFNFYIPAPGFEADHHEVDWDTLIAEKDFVDYESEDELHSALKELPCCTTRKDGTGEGDPINLIVIGDDNRIFRGFVRSGWDETERLSLSSGWRTFTAFFGGEYKHSPMSSLYLFGRAQDMGLQKARDTIHERNHLRLWLSPMRFRGESVWVGTITRDIGIYFTHRAWTLTTHAIDPNVDEARSSIAEELALAGAVERFGFTLGIGQATEEEPHRNLMNAPWWTDGMRLVVMVSDEDVPLEEVGLLVWDWDPDERKSARIRALLSSFEHEEPRAVSGNAPTIQYTPPDPAP